MARKNLNFSNPLQGRHWIKYLRPHPRFGLQIQPGIVTDDPRLGFSLRSNALGLRGPHNQQAANVISGTSFAMGFAVDAGSNWYDLAFHSEEWINLGMPVGVVELTALLDELHRGPKETLLFVYHPNIYTITRNFADARQTGQTLAASMGWETDLWKCLWLTARKGIQQLVGLRSGSFLRFRLEGRSYTVNARYNRFEFERDPQAVTQTLEGLHAMFARFRRVLVARVWMKQELVPARFQNETLRATLGNYEQGWRLLQERVRDLPSVSFHAPSGFELSDYYTGDTHWNEQGNRKFAAFVQGLLAKAG